MTRYFRRNKGPEISGKVPPNMALQTDKGLPLPSSVLMPHSSEFEPSLDQVSSERNVAVRTAMAADIAALFAVRTSVRENHLNLAQLAERGVTPDSVADLLTSRHSQAWVVEGTRGVCGFSIADARSGSISALFVSRKAEGQGYGRALLQVGEEWLFAAGWSTIWLQTGKEPDNRAHGFYRAAGWVMVGPADHGDVRYEKSRAA